jgi:hypothetical protein
MRKRLFTPPPEGIQPHDEGWLDFDRTASVKVTSEQEDYGVDSALVSEDAQGWRAASPGPQTIRLLFDEPQRLRRISLVFEETATACSQEFVLRWSADGGHSFREIVRQQWNLSPPDTVREVEEYRVEEERLVPRSRVSECADLSPLLFRSLKLSGFNLRRPLVAADRNREVLLVVRRMEVSLRWKCKKIWDNPDE